MVKKIDLFIPLKGQYGALHHYTYQLGEALGRQGVEVRFLEAEYNNPRPFLEKIFAGKPNCTLSFNGLLPDALGNFFCDMIKTPHIAYILESPIHFYSLSQSPLNIIACVDQFDVDFFKNIPFNNAFFFPYGADPNIKIDLKSERIYDISMITSLIDYKSIREGWRVQFPELVCKAMNDAAELVLSKAHMTCIEAFVAVIDSYMKGPQAFDPSTVDFLTCLAEIEAYVKGRDRIEMVRAIKNAKVHVFGSSPKGCTWEKYLGDKPNVVIHGPIPFEQSLIIMKQSKIILSSASRIKYGADERIFNCMASGAVPVTERNDFLAQDFTDRKNISFFDTGHWEQIDENVAHFLKNKEERNLVAAEGHKVTMQHHTWNNRAQLLIEKVTPMLEQMSIRA